MVKFFADNASAILALVGVLVGSFAAGSFSLVSAWVMRNRDLNLKLWEKFLDRRIAAHEEVIGLALKLRRMVSAGAVDTSGEVIRVPEVMLSKKTFDNWLIEFADKANPATTWLSTPVKRELNFVQDFLVTAHINLSQVASDDYPVVGSFVRQDFVDLSGSLEKAAFRFFKTEARKLRLTDLEEHHKYALHETKARLQGTHLLSRWTEIKASLAPDKA